MERMTVEEKTMGTTNRPLIIAILSLVLLLISIALTSVLVHRSATSHLREKEQSLRQRFPGYFRFPEEQEAFEALERPSTPVTSFPNVTRTSVSLQCSALLSSPFVPITPAREIEHNACCTTEETYISPEYWVDVTGVNRTMAVFENSNGAKAKQFFRTESCKQQDGCDFCMCSVKTTYVTGVWASGSEYGVTWFKTKGCCKCLNT